ncbi:hypothetical protein CVT24_005493 [Panaeolus cyanescens]|uniref:Uncharacterized protein n=1 Tax=Panaeolus cyanescens TaxID=181874 RepID=A0A409YC68_9AGAR|nr:hypothetical protein CVT24_005493 [Panaeolus cyanescens]
MNHNGIDRFYDVETASTEEDVQLEHANVDKYNNPRSWRLVTNDEDEEVNVRIVGVLCHKDLPPFRAQTEHLKLSEKSRLRQHVKLTGLGLPEFEQGWDIVMQIQNKFDSVMRERSTGRDELETLEGMRWDGNLVVDLHNRYFTYRSRAGAEKDIPFTPDVDPIHVLEDAKGADLVHLTDNSVHYLRKKTGEKGEVKYVKFPPQNFKSGDIVEATYSFVAFPQTGQGKVIKYRLRMVLRALTLMSSVLREEADEKRATEKQKRAYQMQPKAQLKRKKLCYDTDDDGDDDARRLKKMCIDS